MGDPEGPINLGLAEPPALYESGSQRARIFTESWVAAHLFCPNCGARRLAKHPNNAPVADFFCAQCHEQFELKSKKGRMGPKVADGAYDAKIARLSSDTNPNLALMSYDLTRFQVTDLFFVPKQFFTPEIIERRPPLKATARRAGWVGSNILVREVPQSGRVWFVRDGDALPPEQVRESWRATLFMRDVRPVARGWLIEVMKCVEGLGRDTFTLMDAYGFEDRLSRLYPGNNNVRPKIRQQLQVLRDGGFLEFLGRGRYRRRRDRQGGRSASPSYPNRLQAASRERLRASPITAQLISRSRKMSPTSRVERSMAVKAPSYPPSPSR